MIKIFWAISKLDGKFFSVAGRKQIWLVSEEMYLNCPFDQNSRCTFQLSEWYPGVDKSYFKACTLPYFYFLLNVRARTSK